MFLNLIFDGFNEHRPLMNYPCGSSGIVIAKKASSDKAILFVMPNPVFGRVRSAHDDNRLIAKTAQIRVRVTHAC